MHRCLALAEYGSGNVAPNPLVGSVLVHNEKIIGEGFHEFFGGPHAEVNCIAEAEKNLHHLSKADLEKIFAESTLYVSLEPCSHFGKTPPCADLIIEKKIGKVVIGMRDPFSEVNGKGIEKLKAAGIQVEESVLENEAKHINRRFISFHKNKRPYIILKWAESADGFISKKNESGFAISNAYSNRLVHKWRSEEAAIMVGTKTANDDDPQLTTRLWPGNNPKRIVIDKDCRLASSLKLFDASAPTFIFNSKKDLSEKNISWMKIEDEEFLKNLLNKLFELKIQSVLVEGGAKLLQSFIDAGLWDEARVIRNTELQIDEGLRAPDLKNYIKLRSFKIFSDEISEYKIGGE